MVWRQPLRLGGVVFCVALTVTFIVVVASLARHGYVNGHIVSPRAGIQLTDRNGDHLALFKSPDAPGHGYWPLQTVPERVATSMIALEDRHFYAHPGVDLFAIGRAVVQNLRANRRVSGASTLAMQLARMQAGPGPRSWWRKLEEMSVALFMTARYGRPAVLTGYLERVPYGNQIHGIAAAARLYLAKPIADLSWAEIAFLSAIPQAPALSNPYTFNGAERARGRGARALEEMSRVGVLTATLLAAAREELAYLRVELRRIRPPEMLHAIVGAGRALGADRRLNARGRERSRVRLELDLGTQRIAAEEVERIVHSLDDDGARQGAAVVVDLRDFSVRAWVGSTGYSASAGGAIDFVRVARSPGSTLKPFVYAQALDSGRLQPDSVLMDLPGGNGFRNADKGFLGPMLPRQALANSRNLPALRVARRSGVQNLYWMFERLGLHRASMPAKHYGLGLALGALPVTLESLTVAYGALASDGKLRPLKWTAHTAGVERQVMSVATARLVTHFLADKQARLPSFQRLGPTDLPFTVALKTGTSQGYRDAWTMAWTPRFLVGAWIGRDDARAMRRVSGARGAAVLAGAILRRLPGVVDTHVQFPAPPGYRQRQLCGSSGAQAGGGCPRPVVEWLPERRTSRSIETAIVDVRTGKPATSATPGRFMAAREVLRFPRALSPQARTASVAGTAPAGAGRAGIGQGLAGQRAQWSPRTGTRGAGTAAFRISSPADGLRLVRLPDVPAALQSIALRVDAPLGSADLQWFVNGRPFAIVAAGKTARWTLEAGRHVIGVGHAGAVDPAATAIVRVE
jgi:penicillin-binding protein 1C